MTLSCFINSHWFNVGVSNVMVGAPPLNRLRCYGIFITEWVVSLATSIWILNFLPLKKTIAGFHIIKKSIDRTKLGGGFKYCLCSPLFGKASHFDQYFSKGLVQPPTSKLSLNKKLGKNVSPHFIKDDHPTKPWQVMLSLRSRAFFVSTCKVLVLHRPR